MLDGTIQVFYLWDPIKLGYVTYYAAKLSPKARSSGKPGDSFTIEGRQVAGHLHDHRRHRRQIVTGDPLQYTAENYKDHDY